MYQPLGNKTNQRLEPRLDLFEIGEDGIFYYQGFDVSKTNLKPQYVLELPPTSDTANADDIELQEITENAARSTKDLIVQFEMASQGQVQFEEILHMHELQGLDKQLRSSQGSLRVEVAKNVQLEERIKKEKRKLAEIRDNPKYNNQIQEYIRKQIKRYNDELKPGKKASISSKVDQMT